MGSSHTPYLFIHGDQTPPHHITVRPREGKALIYSRTAWLQVTWCLTCCSSHPTHSGRNQHLYYPKSITQSQHTRTLEVLCKADRTEGRTIPFIMFLCVFFKQTACKGETLWTRGPITTKMRRLLASGDTQPCQGPHASTSTEKCFLCSQPPFHKNEHRPDKIP